MSPSARSLAFSRSSQSSNANNDQPPSARANSGRPSGLSKVVPLVPASVPITLRPAASLSIHPSESLPDITKRDRRYNRKMLLFICFVIFMLICNAMHI